MEEGTGSNPQRTGRDLEHLQDLPLYWSLLQEVGVRHGCGAFQVSSKSMAWLPRQANHHARTDLQIRVTRGRASQASSKAK